MADFTDAQNLSNLKHPGLNCPAITDDVRRWAALPAVTPEAVSAHLTDEYPEAIGYELPITVARFNGKRDNTPKTERLSWGEFRDKALLIEPRIRADKDGPAFSLVAYRDGAKRGNKGVIALHGVILDFDEGGDPDAVLKQLGDVEAVVCSTFRDHPAQRKFRVVIPLAEPCSPKDFLKVHRAVAALCGGMVDVTSEDIARLYYLPAAPKNAAAWRATFTKESESAWAETHAGAWAPPHKALARYGAIWTGNEWIAHAKAAGHDLDADGGRRGKGANQATERTNAPDTGDPLAAGLAGLSDPHRAFLAQIAATDPDHKTYVAQLHARRDAELTRWASMAPFVTLEAARTLRREPTMTRTKAWEVFALFPLRHEAQEHQEDEPRLRAIFDAASNAIGGDQTNNDAQWRATTRVEDVGVGSFVKCAIAGGWVDPAAPAPEPRTDDTDAANGESDALIDKMNARYAMVVADGRTIIMDEHDKAKPAHCSVRDFRERHMDRHGKTTVGAFWLAHPRRRLYECLQFAPGEGLPTKQGCYNLWRGFAVEPAPGDCSLFLRFGEEVICGGDKQAWKILEQWLAQMFQRPNEKPGFMVVLVGDEGVGKGTFVHAIGELLGSHYFGGLSSRALTDKFNGVLADKILGFIDECTLTGSATEQGTIRQRITEKLIPLERKGKDAIQVASCHRFILGTNREHAVHASAHARRFFVLEVSDAHRQDFAYFKAIKDQLNAGGREALLHYFLNVDLSDFNPQKAPETKALGRQRLRSLTGVDRTWWEALADGSAWADPAQPQRIHSDTIYGWHRDRAQSFAGSREHVTRRTRELFNLRKAEPFTVSIPGGVPNRLRGWAFPPLAQARSQFARATNTPDEWND